MLGGVTGSGTFIFGGSPESGALGGVTIGGEHWFPVNWECGSHFWVPE